MKIIISLLLFVSVAFAGSQLQKPSAATGGTYKGTMDFNGRPGADAQYLDSDGDGDIDEVTYDVDGDGIDNEEPSDDITFYWNEIEDRYETASGSWWFEITWQIEIFGFNVWAANTDAGINGAAGGWIKP